MAVAELLAIKLPKELHDRLTALSESWGRPKEELLIEALTGYLDWNDRETAETRQALREADAGDFATPEEMEVVWRKWT